MAWSVIISKTKNRLFIPNASKIITQTMSTHLDYSAQMNTLRSVVTTLGDPNTKDDIKLKAAQELSEHFEVITQCPGYQTFLEHSMKIFIKILKDGDPHFITESHIQQVCAS